MRKWWQKSQINLVTCSLEDLNLNVRANKHAKTVCHFRFPVLYMQNSWSCWQNISLSVTRHGKKQRKCWHHSLQVSSKPKQSTAELVLEWQAKVEHIHTERRPQHNLIHSLKLCSRPGRLLHHMVPEIISLWSNKHATFEDGQEELIFQQNYH